MGGELDNCFCAVRPPGHHAERNRAMGFCYFNNIAIAARYLQVQWQVEKCCIIDFDVHHGNGTQAIFEQDPTVFYYSIHQHPSFAYPGTGRDFETGAGKGYGFTKNDTVLPGQGDNEYRELVNNHMLSTIDQFQPDFILVSTGFDAHADDDMSDMKLSNAGYRWIMQKIMELADRHCQGRLISVLEGGYALHRLGELGADHVRVMLND
jgi:acetoin utilization deacetylase AcuC-like enzyme